MEKKKLKYTRINGNIDVVGLKRNLENIKEDRLGDEDNKDKIDFHFISKKKTVYSSYSPSISKDIQKKIKDITTKKLSKVIELIEEKNYVQGDYNPCGQVDGVIEICSKDSIKTLNDIILCFKKENQLESMMNVNDIHTYCFEFRCNDKKIFAFRRFTKMKKLREGFLGTFIGGSFDRIKGDILGVDTDIDLILVEDTVLILNHTALERICDLEEQFKSEAIETINVVKKQNIICNFEEFEKDALSNITVLKRLTRIKGNKMLPLFFQNFDKVVKVSKELELGITFNEDESQIIYEDKTQITQITLLMNDAYYKTLIGSQPGMDKLK